jgi:hypothetical protein
MALKINLETKEDFMPVMDAPRKDTGRKEFDIPPEVSSEDSKPHNLDQMNRMEERYAQFLEGTMDTPVTTEPIETSEPQQATVAPEMDTAQVPEQRVDTQPIEQTAPPSFELKYKTHEDAERAYKEAEKRMHEATQQAAQYRKMVDEQNARMMDLLQQRQAPPPQQTVQVDPQEVEAQFYRDPLNFITGLVNYAVTQTKSDTLKELEGRLSNAAKANQIKRAEQESQGYFLSAHKDIAILEPFVKDQLEQMTKNKDYVQEVVNRHGNVIGASKEMIDKAAEVVKSRIPDLKKFFGGDPGVTRERLPASPVVSPKAGSTVVTHNTDAVDTPQSYIASRVNQQDRITSGRIR